MSLADGGLSAGSTELLSHAWREGTKLQYDTTVRRWGAYCRKWKIDTFTPPIAAVVNFLTSLFEMGLGYGVVASARSALGNFVTVPRFPRLAEHPLVQKLLKGVANGRQPKPRYTRRDTSFLITYLTSLRNGDLDLQHMCWKTSALLTVLSGQRVSTIHKFKLSNLELTDTIALFNITEPLKHSTPSRKPQPVVFDRYPHNEQLCPVRLVQAYLVKRTSLPVVASYDAFFLTHRRPHHLASKDTIARWAKNVLQLSGLTLISISHIANARFLPRMQNLPGYPWKIFHRLASGNPRIASKFYDRLIERTDFTAYQHFADSLLSVLPTSP